MDSFYLSELVVYIPVCLSGIQAARGVGGCRGCGRGQVDRTRHVP